MCGDGVFVILGSRWGVTRDFAHSFSAEKSEKSWKVGAQIHDRRIFEDGPAPIPGGASAPAPPPPSAPPKRNGTTTGSREVRYQVALPEPAVDYESTSGAGPRKIME